ncbi:MAG: GDP-mannose 4,6-dehydratase, partial [Cyanobacteria bacterium J06576_12]
CVDLDWEKYVETDPTLVREDEHFQLMANPEKAKANLDWEPQVSFEQLIDTMVKADLERLEAGTVSPVGVS